MLDFFQTLFQSLAAIGVIIIGIIGFAIIAMATLTMAQAKKVDPWTIGGVLLILVLAIVGIRTYPSLLMDAATESINRMAAQAPEFTQALQRLGAGVTNPWYEWNGEVPPPTSPAPVMEPLPPIFPPTETPVPPVVVVTIEPTAVVPVTPTPGPVTLPTAVLPTAESIPTIDASIWNPMTPAPTPGG